MGDGEEEAQEESVDESLARYWGRRERTVVVSNMGSEVDSDVVFCLFDNAGPVEAADLIMGREAGGVERRWAVVMESVDDVRAALGAANLVVQGAAPEVLRWDVAAKLYKVDSSQAAATYAALTVDDGWPSCIPRSARRAEAVGSGLTLDLLSLVRAKPSAGHEILKVLREGGTGDATVLKLSLMTFAAQWRAQKEKEERCERERAEKAMLDRQIEAIRQQKRAEQAAAEEEAKLEREQRRAERRLADGSDRSRSNSGSSSSSSSSSRKSRRRRRRDTPPPEKRVKQAKPQRALVFEGVSVTPPPSPPPPPPPPAAATPPPADVDSEYVSGRDTRHLYVVFRRGEKLPALKQVHQDFRRHGALTDVKVSKTKHAVYVSFGSRGDAVRAREALSTGAEYSAGVWNFARCCYAELDGAAEKGRKRRWSASRGRRR